jgi:serine/threonine protein phosphatase 1
MPEGTACARLDATRPATPNRPMAEPTVFAVLRAARRVWAIAAVHGEADRLARLHEALAARIAPGDRIVYLGNVLGRGPAVRGAVDALLEFRRAFIALPGVFVHDIAFLRGAQEEMWQRLLQLQFAVNPGEVFGWMVAQGVGATIESYGLSIREGESVIRQGPMAITRWTMKLRAAFQAVPGHQDYLSSLKRAAYTREGTLLFVHRGVDPERPLEAQGDVFWWGTPAFDRIETPFAGFRRVVRGFDAQRRGVWIDSCTASLDAGCGFGGGLVAACFRPDGALADSIEA